MVACNWLTPVTVEVMHILKNFKYGPIHDYFILSLFSSFLFARNLDGI